MRLALAAALDRLQALVIAPLDRAVARAADALDPPADADEVRCPACEGVLVLGEVHVHGALEVVATEWPAPGVLVLVVEAA